MSKFKYNKLDKHAFAAFRGNKVLVRYLPFDLSAYLRRVVAHKYGISLSEHIQNILL